MILPPKTPVRRLSRGYRETRAVATRHSPAGSSACACDNVKGVDSAKAARKANIGVRVASICSGQQSSRNWMDVNFAVLGIARILNTIAYPEEMAQDPNWHHDAPHPITPEGLTPFISIFISIRSPH